jgi:hypothetical protein
MTKYAQLKERALVNFEHLLDFWKINYVQINTNEYDFINPTRKDNNYGACRFNIAKGTGADFTGSGFTSSDFQSIGPGFTKEDFAGFTRGDNNNWGFDIIGLCQRIHGLDAYSDAAKMLRDNLRDLKNTVRLKRADPKAYEQREHKRSEQRLKILKSAERTWNLCEEFPLTFGDGYLRARKIFIRDEYNMRFHAKIYNSELKANIPALLFKVQKAPDDRLVAIHRIYISKDGKSKAKIENPKMALGSIQNAGIWFGRPGPELCIVEGPENALSIRVLGYPFVVCTINATNFSNLAIPSYVNKVILMPDPDEAGKQAALKAIKSYGRKGTDIKLVFPPKRKLENGKLADWNDILQGLGTEV